MLSILLGEKSLKSLSIWSVSLPWAHFPWLGNAYLLCGALLAGPNEKSREMISLLLDTVKDGVEMSQKRFGQVKLRDSSGHKVDANSFRFFVARKAL